MPKKKKPEGIAVNVLVFLPGRRNPGQIDTTVYIDPASIEFTNKPTVAQLQKAAHAKVLDEVKLMNVGADLVIDGDDINVINVEILDDEIAALKEKIDARLTDLKVRVVNGREALAELKAWQRAANSTEE